MKRIVLIFLAITALFLLAIQYIPNSDLSPAQKDTIKALGYPHQFVISYLPSGDEENPTLMRTEVWYYPNQQVKIIFNAGDVFHVEGFSGKELENVSPTPLKPEDFEFEMNFSQVQKSLNENIEKLDFIPTMFEEGTYESYISENAIFVIENQKLTYLQTIGIGEESTNE